MVWRVGVCGFVAAVMSIWPAAEAGADTSAAETNQGLAAHVVISEIQTGSKADASQEFVELYNPTASPADLSGWQLQYKSATGSAWSKKAVLAGIISPGGFYLISSLGYLSQADATFSSGLSGSAGHIRLVDQSGAAVDVVGWGKAANASETAPAPAPPAGQSIERLPGWLLNEGGNAVDTDDNSQDFLLRQQPEPQSTASLAEQPQPSPDTSTVSTDEAPAPVAYPAVQITELLPNPASPQTDANDEFIELYNPNDSAVDIGGYVLKTGSNFHASYVLPQRVIPAGAYLAVYSVASRLSLPNGGGAAQLLSPDGTVIDQTQAYPAAKDGLAFAADGGEWQWTLQPTPGLANIIVADDATASAVKLTASVAKVKKSASPKPKASKSPKAAKPKKTPSAKPTLSPLSASLAAATPPSGHWLLVLLAGLTLAYVGFEFRYDLQNFYFRARGYRRSGRPTREQSGRRRSD